ncbi:thyrotropin-releasing hormone-degrading ectoenzyme-like isoform X1 [Bombus vosnesenskii]|uniref:Thyrotropin-releasing hormone-degrading ectoenzyme-like isoform X1 n=1 Tax=Bombus vosnesenskii TaxID=207650 RepID=A0A6J3LL15_9HYME|nr:thyrotropin-releasing hormone-degrading ectoenzyme-like isoform X1 [Bombus vosnesenskii]
MSRGSISSWQDYGRRSSQCMPQFSGGPVQFMTYDDMEYKRGDGWFLSYTKIAGIIVVFIIGVVAAGFLGWYINSLPKKRPYEILDLQNDGIEDTDDVDESISPFIRPLKYRLELTPIIDMNGPSRLIGHVYIDFQVNDTISLNKLSLNVKNITVTSYKLSLLDLEENKKPLRKRRRRGTTDVINNVNRGNDTTSVSRTMCSIENDVVISLSENETLVYDENVTNSSENRSSDEEANVTLSNYALVSDTDKIDDSNVDEIIQFESVPPAVSPGNASSQIQITQYDIDADKEVHTIYLGSRIQQGIYLLEIEYDLLIDEHIFFIGSYNSSGEGKWLMGTKLKESGARCLFPVFDDTVNKSVISVSVARPKEMTVLSNMPLRSLRDTSDNSMVVDTFDDSLPISPHNLAFVMGHIEAMNTTFVGDTEVVATFWCESNRSSEEIYLFDKLDSVVVNLIDVFLTSYPYPKLDVVSLPPGIDENMGNPGLIALKQSLFYTSKKSPHVTKADALKVLINLVGQQWLDEFTNVNRTDAWIFESLLVYIQHVIVQQIDSSLDLSDSFIADVQLHVMEIDGYSVSRPFHENANYHLWQSLNYEHAKGACLIRMLHGAIGDTDFRNGYKKLITRWKHNNTDITDFMNILAEEAMELPSGVSLQDTMNSWISQGGYPFITVVRNYEEESATIYQEQFALDRPFESISKFWHISLSYANNNSNWSSPATIWFPPEPKITLDGIGSNESWVLFNVNKTGFYRVHYDETNWMLLKLALTENHELFPPETRASLVDDVFSLAEIGLMKYDTAFEFIKYMQMKERHYLPWGAFMRHMFKLNRLLYETPVFTDFQEFIARFVSPLYSEVGSKLEEGSALTMTAVKLACAFDHSQCLDWSRNVSEVVNSIHKIVPSYIRDTFYCTIARYGTRREWNYFMERIKSTEDEEEKKRLLSSFACFQTPWILQFILNDILHEERFEEDEMSVILNAFSQNPAAAQVAFRFVRANWQEIAQRFLGSYKVLKSFVLSMMNGLTTEQDLQDLQMFRENNYDSMKGTRYAAALVEANGNFETTWLKHSLPQIESMLKEETQRFASP